MNLKDEVFSIFQTHFLYKIDKVAKRRSFVFRENRRPPKSFFRRLHRGFDFK